MFRIRLRYRLRTLLVLFIPLCLGLGWFTHEYRRAARERNAAWNLHHCRYDFEYDSDLAGLHDRVEDPIYWQWFGEGFSHDIVSAAVNGRHYEDGGAPYFLKQINQLPKLRMLCLEGRIFGDEEIAALRSFPELEHLFLMETRVGNAAMRWVGERQGLKTLAIWDAPVTDAGLAEFVALHGLEHLDLRKTEIGDRNLEGFPRFLRLRTLCLAGTNLDSDGLVRIAPLQTLETLTLAYTQVDTLEPIAGLGNLSDLNVRHTPVDDDGVRWLARLSKLEILCLDGTRITDRGAAHLIELQELRELSIKVPGLTDRTAALLPRLRKLESLTIDSRGLSGTGWEELAKLSRLKSLEIVETSASSEKEYPAYEFLLSRLPRTHVTVRDPDVDPFP